MPPMTNVQKRKPDALSLNADIGTGERGLLKQQAYVALKTLIQDSTFPPGEFLSERQLAARLGMSKTPVKAALERLEFEGFITVSPQQGIVVRDLSIHEIADLFEIRLAMETFVVRAIAGKLTAAQQLQLQRNLDQQTQAATSNDVRPCVQLDTEFHRLLCEFHGNREILLVMSRLREKMHRLISRVFANQSGRPTDSAREHAAIAQAVVEGDAELAAHRMEQHLEFGKQSLLSPRHR
jgi:DNA-binding GntR family transcriptional regulator